MEHKSLFEMKTAWPFPVLRYTADTSYVEVRKASGIAYILLQLISSSENNSEKLVSTLKRLDVPHDIHYIFAGELAYMISYGIIRMKSGRDFDADLLDMYQISDFEITDLGKKLFKEGTIPTGNDKIKHLNVYYDVSVKDIQVKFDRKLFRLDNSALDENCIGDVVLNNSDIEMFITENLSKYAFRKGERISGFEHQKPEILAYKMDDAVTLRITSEGMQIQAKDKDRDAFIHKFYSSVVITRILDAKKKYRFADFLASDVHDYDFNELVNITNICMPYQILSVTNVKSQLSWEKKCEIRGSECALDKNESAELMSKCGISGVACYFERGKLYSIVPGRFYIHAEGFSEKCAINLIAVLQQEDSVQQQLMREIFFRCIDVSEPFEKCNVIKKLTQISGCKDYLEKLSNTLINRTDSDTEKIDTFVKLNDEFVKEVGWTGYSKDCAEGLFEKLCNYINRDGFAAQNILGKKLNKIIRLNEIEYVTRISKKLIDSEDDAAAFETLESAGLNVDVILSVINIFKLFCKRMIEGIPISGNSKLSGEFTLLERSFSELKELTGIDNPFEDSSKLDFNYDRFIQSMAAFTDSMKKIEKHKNFAMDEYKYLSLFRERFIEVKEMVTIEKEATKNPKSIDKNYIEQKLKKSKYKDAVCDLHVRLQYELNRLFNTENIPTFALLSDQRMVSYLNQHEIDDMHTLRKCRNGFQHPKSKRNVPYSEKTIREWCAVVEKLGEMSNESCGEN